MPIQKKIWKKVGKFNQNNFYQDDFDFWLKINKLQNIKIRHLNKALYIYNKHNKNMSKVFSQKFNQIKDFNQKFDIMILVTGSSGFIGSNLIQYLKKKKKSFYGIDLKQNKYLKFKNFAKVDISSLRSVHNFFKKKSQAL